MSEWLAERWQVLRNIVGRRWFKVSAAILSVIGAYDLLGAQLLPKWIAEKLPPVREVIGMTSGWLPWWAWGWLGTALLAGAAVEYAVRLHRAAKPTRPRNQSPFVVLFSNSYGEVRFAEHTMRMPLTVRNSSPSATFDDVEVHLIEVTHRAPRRGTQSINHKLIERSSGSTSFTLLPKMPHEVLFLCLVTPQDGRPSVLKIGPQRWSPRIGQVVKLGST